VVTKFRIRHHAGEHVVGGKFAPGTSAATTETRPSARRDPLRKNPYTQ
jgi:hypothetical protein